MHLTVHLSGALTYVQGLGVQGFGVEGFWISGAWGFRVQSMGLIEVFRYKRCPNYKLHHPLGGWMKRVCRIISTVTPHYKLTP